jgi:HEPN domain-containing protein
MSKNAEEAGRWLTQAEADISVAEWNFKGKFWWEVCFKCQQAAEKALKAFRYAQGERSILSHSVLELGKACVQYDREFNKHEKAFRVLDRYYITTRYPNGLPGLTPSEYFDEDEAAKAISSAREIIALVKSKLGTKGQ